VTLREFLGYFGGEHHVAVGSADHPIDLSTPVKETTFASSPGGLLQHWCRAGAVIVRITLDTMPEYIAYLVYDDSMGQDWEFGRIAWVRRVGNDFEYTKMRGSRPFATLRLILGELERTRRIVTNGGHHA
jgi:hypothetical protein